MLASLLAGAGVVCVVVALACLVRVRLVVCGCCGRQFAVSVWERVDEIACPHCPGRWQ